MKLIHTSKLLQSWHPIPKWAPAGVTTSTNEQIWDRTENVVRHRVDEVRAGIVFKLMKVNIP